jgi:hypothetical protein
MKMDIPPRNLNADKERQLLKIAWLCVTRYRRLNLSKILEEYTNVDAEEVPDTWDFKRKYTPSPEFIIIDFHRFSEQILNII